MSVEILPNVEDAAQVNRCRVSAAPGFFDGVRKAWVSVSDDYGRRAFEAILEPAEEPGVEVLVLVLDDPDEQDA